MSSFKIFSEQKNILLIVLVGSAISFLTLTYQTYLFYVEGSCGCSGNVTFQIYSAIWGIPISLLGMVGLGVTMLLSAYFLSNYSKRYSARFNDQLAKFFAFFQLISFLVVLNMMYIVYIVAQSFCELCSISQLVGTLNFILVMFFYSHYKWERYMRSSGLKLVFIGIFPLILFWYYYFTNIAIVLSYDKMIIFLILFIGLIVTVICGILISLGIKVIFNPEFYEKLLLFIK